VLAGYRPDGADRLDSRPSSALADAIARGWDGHQHFALVASQTVTENILSG
jgi:ABC-type uncharacterized transport system ATPase subunit